MAASAGCLDDLDKMNDLNGTGCLPAVNGRLGLNTSQEELRQSLLFLLCHEQGVRQRFL